MGLDISVEPNGDNFRAGSYSGFAAWREWLASQVGIDLNKMDGFGGVIPWTGAEPFGPLLNHPDNDGFLKKRDCKRLSKDFQKYFFIILNSNRPVNEDFNWAWCIQKYIKWKESVDEVADGTNALIRFC